MISLKPGVPTSEAMNWPPKVKMLTSEAFGTCISRKHSNVIQTFLLSRSRKEEPKSDSFGTALAIRSHPLKAEIYVANGPKVR